MTTDGVELPWTLRAAVVLVSFEALVAALAGGAGHAPRLVLAAVALAGLGLLSSSLHAFPSPTLPKG